MNAPNAPYCYAHPRPAVTVDVVTFRVVDKGLYVLLIQRKREPFKGCWANPGGFVDENERPQDAALRELREETGLDDVILVPIGAFGDPGRDPRGWTISIGYVGYQRDSAKEAVPGDDALEVRWFPVTALPTLAFDHRLIIIEALKRVVSDALLACAIATPGRPQHLGRAQSIFQKALDCLEPPNGCPQ